MFITKFKSTMHEGNFIVLTKKMVPAIMEYAGSE